MLIGLFEMESSDSLESILHKLHQETFGPRHLNIYQASKEIIGLKFSVS